MKSIDQKIIDKLRSFLLKSDYCDEQKDLQPHIGEELKKVLDDQEYDVILSTKGQNKPWVGAVGASFWPDILISNKKTNEDLMAIEVKWIRKNKSATKAIEEAIGQAVIYSTKYRKSIVFILHEGIVNSDLCEYDAKLLANLEKINIGIIIRRRATEETEICQDTQKPIEFSKTIILKDGLV